MSIIFIGLVASVCEVSSSKHVPPSPPPPQIVITTSACDVKNTSLTSHINRTKQKIGVSGLVKTIIMVVTVWSVHDLYEKRQIKLTNVYSLKITIGLTLLPPFCYRNTSFFEKQSDKLFNLNMMILYLFIYRRGHVQKNVYCF